ncbi:type I polyketide synthase [Acuticoccus sp. I52.16.1]|uniref:type I polyketide synthase n=1 Tax=Acuticoccus sp. I52.16.1 TaxID=2928472 RepID=UPI001FCFC97D|nr:type I polyketide synthase [Acuticoccus sp. I52.16.1]UOM34326.1 type I polyketide synthase [Acuticoccus sp. I52.16.1]
MTATAPPQGSSPASLSERALQAIRDLKAEVKRLEGAGRAPVAIVGMGCRFPGAADLEGFWELLVSGADPMGPPPADRWNIDAFYSPDPDAPGKTVAREGGYVPDLDKFDAAFWGISPREATFIDPRQRLVLETAWEALENAGIAPSSLARSRTGVFMGVLTNDYHHLVTSDPTWISAATGTGTANAIIANRLSYVLDLKGPSVSLDTACAGSLVAIHLACHSLRAGESALALAGGVAANLLPSPDISFSRMGALAPYARCRTFDADAAGMVRSEGAGVIVLKLLDRAIADGDRIHAVIRGSTVNHDGRSNGIASPNGRAQVALLREAYANAGIAPGMVQYIEAHGTGTTVGDAIEIQALSEVLGEGRPAGRPVVYGSVKSNIGHTESAAGVAGVIKTALAMSRRTIPPNLHIETLNPAIAAAPFPVEVHRAPGAFPVADEPVIAGVSGFSFGGTNAHVVLEEAPAHGVRAVPARPEAPDRVHLVPLSAASPEALADMARRLAARLSTEDAPPLADVAYTAALRRSHLDHRLVVAGRVAGEMRSRLLAAVGAGEDESAAEATALGRAMAAEEVRIAFVFSGQGSEWVGMGADLMAREPAFRAALEGLEPHFLRYAGWSLLEALADTEDRPRRHAIDVVQPLIFAVQTALVALWRAWGVEPAEVVGQSMGEVAAAHACGALCAEDAVRVVTTRSRLLKTRSGAGATAVVGLGEAAARAALAPYEGRLDVAGMTSFNSTVIAGETPALEALFRELEGEGTFCRLLETIEVPAHSPVMDDLVPQLEAELRGIVPHRARVPFVSTVTAAPHPGEALGPAYWGGNLRKPFRVAEAVAGLAARGTTVFVEVSPHPVVSGALRQCFEDPQSAPVVVRSLTRGTDGPTAMAAALGALHVAGAPVDWSRQVAPDAQLADLPVYPWQRRHHWVDALGTPELYHGDGGRADVHPLLGRHVALAHGGAHVFTGSLDPGRLTWLADHRVGEMPVLPAAAAIEMATAAARAAFGWEAVAVTQASFERMMLLGGGGATAVQTTLTPTGAEAARVTIHARPADAADATWTLHASATVARAPSRAAASHPPAAAAAARQIVADGNAAVAPPAVPSASGPSAAAGGGREIDVAGFYAEFARRGLVYGPAFQGIGRLTVGAETAEARIAAPLDARSYALHPAALDAAFQSVAAILSGAGASTAYLPSAVGRVEVVGGAGEGVVSHARVVAGARDGADSLTADLVLTDPAGAPVARVTGLVLTRFDEIAAPGAEAMASASYRLAWVPEPREPAAQGVPGAVASFVIADDNEGTGHHLAAALAARGARAVRVAHGPQQVEAVVRHLVAAPEAGLVHLAAAAEATPAAVRGACGALLAEVQAMIGRRAPVWLVTRGAQSLAAHEAPALVQAPLWGLARILGIEHPELMGGLVDLDPAAPAGDVAALVEEIVAPVEAPQVALRGGVRHAARLERLHAPGRAAVPFRPDATYLVTGGLTGLGLVTARWMAQNGAQHFLMLNRTPLPPRRTWARLAPATPEAERVAAVRALEGAGKSVHVEAMDIADEAALGALLARWEAELRPPIRGIVHAAGGIDDKLLANLAPGDFDTVMRPKVDGTLALDRASRVLPLDHFVVYASATSILGQIGQANYAAANAFEDGLAFARRAAGLPASVVNWGPWGEVGLYARRALKDHAAIAGVGDILPEEGMEALGRQLAAGWTQSVVVKADWSRAAASVLTRTLAAGAATGAATGADGPAAGGAGGDGGVLELVLLPEAERRQAIGARVAEMVAAVLKLDPDQVHRRRPVTAFGMDSIMAVELRNRIRVRFGVALTMVQLFTGTVDEITERVDAALMADEELAALVAEVESLPADVVAAMLSGEREVA